MNCPFVTLQMICGETAQGKSLLSAQIICEKKDVLEIAVLSCFGHVLIRCWITDHVCPAGGDVCNNIVFGARCGRKREPLNSSLHWSLAGRRRRRLVGSDADCFAAHVLLIADRVTCWELASFYECDILCVCPS